MAHIRCKGLHFITFSPDDGRYDVGKHLWLSKTAILFVWIVAAFSTS
jgi:hypothetical protein